MLDKEGYIPYTELMEKLGLDQTGQLNFHLKKLGSLVSKDNKSYYLTEDGKRVLKILNLNDRILSGEEIEYLNSKGSEISRVGVIICNCNTEISNVININALENYINKLQSVVSVKIFENLCHEKNLDKIEDWVRDNYLNKAVIAACSPKTHQHVFERIFEGIIDKTNIEIANIREQCCWVHQSNGKILDANVILKKAELLIEAAVGRVVLQKEIKVKRVEIEKSCAVIGGGIGGMTTALNLARAGIKVYLIEKSPTLGGKIARWHRIYGMGDCSICFISELIGEIAKEPNIEIHTNTEIERVSGEVGNFTIELIKRPRYVDEKKCTGCKQCIEVCGVEKTNQYEFGLNLRKIIHIPYTNAYPYIPLIEEEDIKNCLNCGICERACVNKAIDLDQKPERFKIKAGIKVISIGAASYSDLEKYHYDPKEDIITSLEFERMLSSDGITEGRIIKFSDNEAPKTISIIQNVGPTKYQGHYNDMITQKYLNCIKVKLPSCKVNIFNKNNDLAKLEDHPSFYLDPKFHFCDDITIKIKDGHSCVVADGQIFPSDLIILNVTLMPNRDLKELRKSLDFALNNDGFMSEDTLASGIYGVGTILGPKNYEETISSANKVALKIISILSRDYLMSEFTGIKIDSDKCGLCGICLESCPFNAITFEGEKLSVDKFKCKGCGTCVSVCPTNAIEMNVDSSDKIMATIKVFSKFNKKPKIIAFCCQSCGYAAADDAGLKKIFYHPNIFIIRVPCTGRVDTEFILKSFELGFDGVMIIGCRKDACRYIDGIHKAQKKVHLLKRVLGPRLGHRVIIRNLNAVEGNKFSNIVNKFYEILEDDLINET